MKRLVENALRNSFSYTEYKTKINENLLEGKSTGCTQSEDLLNYSNLNKTRMNRLDKTMIIDENLLLIFRNLKKEYIWLVLSEGWCGDAAQIVPILNKISEVCPKIDLKIVFRDDNEPLMNLFLTNGTKSIPKLIILDKTTLNICGDWGPRPKGSEKLIADYKAKFGVVDTKAKEELQLWYLHDKGISTQTEIATLMQSLE